MLRSEYRKVLAWGAVTGLALPLFASPAAATPPKDWPALPPSVPAAEAPLAPLTPVTSEAPARTVVRESRALSGRIYEVRPGDTLWAIAERQFGDATRWPELFEANRSRLANPHQIRPNQKLQLGSVQQASRSGASRARGDGSYTVRSGDTLGKIAQRQLGKASDWPVLYALNRETLANPHQIYPGQVLRMSGSRRDTVVVAPRATVKRVSPNLSRKSDDGRLLKGHRRVNGSYYAKGNEGKLIWADTQEQVHPTDSTLKTQLAPKIREAFKVPEPTPVVPVASVTPALAPKPVASAPVASKPAAPVKPAAPATPKPAPSQAVASKPAKVLIELPPGARPTFLTTTTPPATTQDRMSAGALSLVVPGAGQLYNGDPLRAGLFMGAGAAGLGAAVYGIANDRQDLGVAASAGLIALSLWSATDAYLNAPARPARR
ncbi:LysM domain/BON superfamily protein [compost metagenome]